MERAVGPEVARDLKPAGLSRTSFEVSAGSQRKATDWKWMQATKSTCARDRVFFGEATG